jgi:hypothetical protein
MSVHIHTMRACCTGALGLILAAILLGWTYSPAEPIELVPVTGRVTCGSHPLGGMRVWFQEDAARGFSACGEIQPDGSFRMQPSGRYDRDGVAPGTYRVHFIGHPSDAPVAPVGSKYQATQTSDLLVHVRPDWNDFALSLPDPG